MGIGILWFMPIHPIGVKNRLGTLGSYYSVRDHLAVNPEFGTLQDFKTLVQEIHKRGMYVIIDWVGNHTAWDHRLTLEHPEWYMRDANGRFIPPPGTNWTDVIQLDYSQSGLREYMIQAMKFWIEETDIDGFRCDAVSMMPKEFWKEAIPALKLVKPNLFMLAEADGPEWYDLGFDMTYAWGLYGFGDGVLARIAEGSNNASHLSSYVSNETTKYTGAKYRMYFLSNHDENSWYGTPYELFGEAEETFHVLITTLPGMPLVYSGEEAGLDTRLAFFEKDCILWREHKNANLFTTLFHLKKRNPALWNGDQGGLFRRVLTNNNTDVFAFIREKQKEKIFAVFNLSNSFQHVSFKGTAFIGFYRDVFTGDTLTFSANGEMTLFPWGYGVYEAIGVSTGFLPELEVSHSFFLGQNYPNPFNASTRISYSLPEYAQVTFKVFDLLGKPVWVFPLGMQPPGMHEITFSGEYFPCGMYFYQMEAGEKRELKRMVLVR